MKIHVNERGGITSIKDAQFVANASFATNVIDAVFELPTSDDAYCLVSVIRPDGKVINDLQALLEIGEDGERIYRYSIVSGDGVLYCKGALQVSVQLIEDGRVLASATVTAHVFHNIGKNNQAEYDAFQELINSEASKLAQKVNANTVLANEAISQVEEWAKTERLIDFTVDPKTGIGVKYYDNGKTATVHYPTTGSVANGEALIKELTFTIDSFTADGECAFSPQQTGFDDSKYLANVEIKEGNAGYTQLSDAIFKGNDGSLLITLNKPFEGRVLMCGAGCIAEGRQGEVGTQIFFCELSGAPTRIGADIYVLFDKWFKPSTCTARENDFVIAHFPETTYDSFQMPCVNNRVYLLQITKKFIDNSTSDYLMRGETYYCHIAADITNYARDGSAIVLTEKDILPGKNIVYRSELINPIRECRKGDIFLCSKTGNYGYVTESEYYRLEGDTGYPLENPYFYVLYVGSFKGVPGSPFTIAATYPSISEMKFDFYNPNVPFGAFVAIDTGDVNDEDNAKLYRKGENQFEFIMDLSGAVGLTGPSAYEVAVKNGFSGTEAEWLVSLIGRMPRIRCLETKTVASTDTAWVGVEETEDGVGLRFYVPRGPQGLQGNDGEPGSIVNLPLSGNGKILYNDNGAVGYLDASAILGESFGGSEPTPLVVNSNIDGLYLIKSDSAINAMRTAARVCQFSSDGSEMFGGISVDACDNILSVVPLSVLVSFGLMDSAPEDSFALINMEGSFPYYVSHDVSIMETNYTAGWTDWVAEDGKIADNGIVADISILGQATRALVDAIFSSSPSSHVTIKDYVNDRTTIRIVNFNENDFENGSLTLSASQTGISNNNFIVNVERRVDNGYEVTGDAVIKGDDGSITLDYNVPFEGRVAIYFTNNN